MRNNRARRNNSKTKTKEKKEGNLEKIELGKQYSQL